MRRSNRFNKSFNNIAGEMDRIYTKLNKWRMPRSKEIGKAGTSEYSSVFSFSEPSADCCRPCGSALAATAVNMNRNFWLRFDTLRWRTKNTHRCSAASKDEKIRRNNYGKWKISLIRSLLREFSYYFAFNKSNGDPWKNNPKIRKNIRY